MPGTFRTLSPSDRQSGNPAGILRPAWPAHIDPAIDPHKSQLWGIQIYMCKILEVGLISLSRSCIVADTYFRQNYIWQWCFVPRRSLDFWHRRVVAHNGIIVFSGSRLFKCIYIIKITKRTRYRIGSWCVFSASFCRTKANIRFRFLSSGLFSLRIASVFIHKRRHTGFLTRSTHHW